MDSGSWFVFVLRLAVPVGGKRGAAQFLLGDIDQADGRVVEADEPLTVFGLFDGDGLAHERGGDGDEIAPPSDFAVRADSARRRLGRIVRLGESLGHRARRGLIDAGRSALAERFMGPLFIIVAGETGETALLCRQIGFGWLHRLQKRAMKPFVPAILLGMARIDPLVTDAQVDLPGRQRRQSGNAGRGEGRAVVGADRLRQAVFPKSPFEQRLGFVVPGAGGAETLIR